MFGNLRNHPRQWFTFGATALLTDPPLLGMVEASKQMQRGNVSSYGYLKKWRRIPTIADELALSVNPAFEPWATCSGYLLRCSAMTFAGCRRSPFQPQSLQPQSRGSARRRSGLSPRPEFLTPMMLRRYLRRGQFKPFHVRAQRLFEK
jgi:hypothetical protein